jgi:hypothetical protein
LSAPELGTPVRGTRPFEQPQHGRLIFLELRLFLPI